MRYSPGISGNPIGRPKSQLAKKTIDKSREQFALGLLGKIMQDQTSDPSHRIQAASVILRIGREVSAAYDRIMAKLDAVGRISA